MKNNIIQPFPVFPKRRDTSSSSTSDNLAVASSSSISTDQEWIHSIYIYIKDVHEAVIPRMEEYERIQDELKQTIAREKIIENTTRRLLNINIIMCILLPLILFLSFLSFCFYYAPTNVAKFFDDYKVLSTLFSLATLAFIGKPLYDIHQYSKRIEAIEKRLKLNGND